jgi:hypothetical protein
VFEHNMGTVNGKFMCIYHNCMKLKRVHKESTRHDDELFPRAQALQLAVSHHRMKIPDDNCVIDYSSNFVILLWRRLDSAGVAL